MFRNGSCYDVTVLQCYIGVKKILFPMFFLASLGKYQEVFEKGLHVLKISLDELEDVSRYACEFSSSLLICLFKMTYICDKYRILK